MARKRKKIRVGLIGGNRRGLWYGAIFDDIDPHAYANLAPMVYHHSVVYLDVELAIRRATGFRLTKVYDPDSKAAEITAGAFRTNPKLCKSLDEVSDDVDLVFIANESGDGSDHLKLATPGLKKGVPTFIDRPFASTVKDTKAMISLARRNRAPLLSCSHMIMLEDVRRFKESCFLDAPYLRAIKVFGRGPSPALVADGIALAMTICGDEFGGRLYDVRSSGDWPLEFVHLHWRKKMGKGDRELVAFVMSSHLASVRNQFHVLAGIWPGVRGERYLDDLDASLQYEGGLAVMNAVKEMIKTGVPPISCADMIEAVAANEAGRRAHNKGKPFPLARLR